MKQFFAWIICLLLVAVPARAQWQWLNPKPNAYAGREVRFVDANRGFVLQTPGMLLRTDDAGLSWQEVQRYPGAVDLEFSPEGTGYLLTRAGVLWRSTDRGTNWQRVSRAPQPVNNIYYGSDLQYPYASLHALRADTVVEVTENGLVRRSTDGGRSWQQASVTGVQRVLSSAFVSGRVGYVGASYGRIYKTIDGGASWVKLTEVSYVPSEITMLHFISPRIGFAHREHSDLLRTTDGGQTWAVLPNRLEDTYAMHFVSATTGFAVGDVGVVYTTTDAGASWTSLGPAGGGFYGGYGWTSVCFTSPSTGYVTGTGYRGPIMRTTDGGRTWLPLGPLMGDMQAVEFPGHGLTGYALSGSGLLKTTDGGDTWTVQAPVGGNRMACPDANTVVIAGGNSTVTRSGDGGQTWTSSTVPAQFPYGTNLIALEMVDSQVGYVAGDNNGLGPLLARTTDGGRSWQSISSGAPVNPLRYFSFPSATTGFALTYNTVYRTTNGGQSWQALNLSSMYVSSLAGLDFVDAQTGYVVDDSGQLFKTTDGGATWTASMLNRTRNYASGHPRNIRFFDRGNGCVQDDAGNVFRTTDGGANWLWERNLSSQSAAYTRNGQALVLGGRHGMLVRHSLAQPTRPFRARALPPVALTDSSATLAAALTTVNCSVDSLYFEYGPTSGVGYPQSTFAYNAPWYLPDSLRGPVFNGLQPATSYRVRLRFVHNGVRFYSTDTTFTTAERPAQPMPELVAYPNPTTGYLRVLAAGQRGRAHIELFSLQGHRVYQTDGAGLDLTNLPNGMYLLRVQLGDQVYRRRIVKQ
ncbi:YCF48-related protein [Hymenobacter jeollabukensis]|nr:YCF48-related protein [Hymenobacter jeollabukensis]